MPTGCPRSRHGVTTVFLGTTAQYRAAHRFYEKNGFCRIDESSLPPDFPRVHVDTIFYQYIC